MTTETKKALLGFGAGFLLFFLTIKVFGKKKETSIEQPPITPENINLAAETYRAAIQAGEPTSKLHEINNLLAKEYGLRVNSLDGVSLTVADLSGKTVKQFPN